MAVLLRALAIVAALAVAARADELADAKQAIGEVRYDDAEKLLVSALAHGHLARAQLIEAYQLAASTEVVLGHADVGEQYYRRWLAIDPAASLSNDLAPKLREPFVAAQAYTAAHGRLSATAARVDATTVDVQLVADPLAMARTACAGAATAPFADAHARLATSAPTVALCDESGNQLVELTPVARPAVAPAQPATVERPLSRRASTWAIPAVITGVAAFICLGLSFQQDEMLPDNHKTALAIAASITGAAAIGFTVPALIFYFDDGGSWSSLTNSRQPTFRLQLRF